MFKSDYNPEATLKIYAVMHPGSTKPSKLWTSYQSAVNSAAGLRGNAHVKVADIPDDAWRDPNRLEERQARRVSRLFTEIVWTDQQRAQQLIAELTRLVEERANVYRQGQPPVLDEKARAEAEVMFKLDRLVDAQ